MTVANLNFQCCNKQLKNFQLHYITISHNNNSHPLWITFFCEKSLFCFDVYRHLINFQHFFRTNFACKIFSGNLS